MASEWVNKLGVIKHCLGIYEQNSIANKRPLASSDPLPDLAHLVELLIVKNQNVS